MELEWSENEDELHGSVSSVFEEPYPDLENLCGIFEEKLAKSSKTCSLILSLVECLCSEKALENLEKLLKEFSAPQRLSLNVEATFMVKGQDEKERFEKVLRVVKIARRTPLYSLYFDPPASDTETGESIFPELEEYNKNFYRKREHNKFPDLPVSEWLVKQIDDLKQEVADVKVSHWHFFDSYPFGTMGQILSYGLRRNVYLITLKCAAAERFSLTVNEADVTMIVESLEANKESKLAYISLYDGSEGPEISDAIQRKLFNVICRNAYLLDDPLEAACPIYVNLEADGPEGYTDEYAVDLVKKSCREHGREFEFE